MVKKKLKEINFDLNSVMGYSARSFMNIITQQFEN